MLARCREQPLHLAAHRLHAELLLERADSVERGFDTGERVVGIVPTDPLGAEATRNRSPQTALSKKS